MDVAFSPASVSTAYSSDLPVRTSCDFCRSKKIRCDKKPSEEGGCSRCRRENRQCRYDIREPIGRPKKRKVHDWTRSQSPLGEGSTPTSETNILQRRAREGSQRELKAQTSPIIDSVQQIGEHNILWTEAASSWKRTCCSSLARSSPQGSTSVIGSTSASTSGTSSFDRSSYTSIDTVRQADEQPTLSDLGLAAFLESLDTLEINTKDGLTPSMLQNLSSGIMSINGGSNDSALLGGMLAGDPSPSGLSFGSLLDAQSSTSYAVPADLSWADSSWLNHSTFKENRSSEARSASIQVPSIREDASTAVTKTISSPQERTKEEVRGPCPKTGREACCCGVNAEKDSTKSVIKTPSETSRVHCVPNPNGQGCTCLCDVSVALINVRATLRQAREQAQEGEGDQEGQALVSTQAAASTLQLTLSASQAVAAQCACSASCPTCRSDPSTSLSASLLVSTALQIYIRAVRTLREGFGASAGNDLDVSLGLFKPAPRNARRIALFAMKLELRDLRDAIAKVSSAASEATNVDLGETATSSEPSQSARAMEGLNAIDNVVIKKLHQQLDDLLHTVEGIEQQQET